MHDLVNYYRKGRIAEGKVAKRLKTLGFKNVRKSAGSRGPADIYARKGANKYYFQVKSGAARLTGYDVRRLRAHAKKRGGTAVGIHKAGPRMRWRFFGNWG